MTPDTARSIIEHLVGRINFEMGSNLSNLTFGAERNPDWAEPWLSRIAVLVGDVARVEYVSGFIVPDDERRTVRGEMVVFTEGQVIRAAFQADTTSGYLHPVGTVTMRRRSAVVGVSVDDVARLAGRSGDGWPEHLSITVTFDDGATLELPLRPSYARRPDHDLVAFLPHLLAY